MNNESKSRIDPSDFHVEIFLAPQECLALMDAVIQVARRYSSTCSDEVSSQLYDIYDDLSLALNQTLLFQNN